MKRHTRWDQKRSPTPPVDGENMAWQEWKDPNNSTAQTRNLSNLDTQAPLDYSTECRSRAESDQIPPDTNDSTEKVIDFTKPPPLPMMPPHWPLYSNYTAYPGSSRSSSISYPPPSSWQHPEQYFMDNSSYMKWWPQQRQSGNQFSSANQYGKKDKWNMNTRHHKEQSQFYNDYTKRLTNNKTHLKENQFQATTFNYHKNKYKSDNAVKDSHNSKYTRNLTPDSKYCGNTSTVSWNNSKELSSRLNKRKECSLKYRKGEKFQTHKYNVPPTSLKVKNSQTSKSSAERANSKAFSIAAKKLRQTFLATQKGKRKGKSTKSKGKFAKLGNKSSSIDNYKRIPTDSISNKGASTSMTTKRISVLTSSRTVSDSKSLFTIDTDSESEDSDNFISDLNASSHSLYKNERKRHCSESCILLQTHKSKRTINRTRSLSTSSLDICKSSKDEKVDLRSTIIGKVKGIVAEQLLKDKNFANTQWSKKLKLLMENLNHVSRSYFAEKLLTERLKITSQLPNDRDDNDVSAHLDSLSEDVLQQIKDILEMEANNKGDNCLDEISLSIADLISGSIKKNQCNMSYDSNQSEYLESEIEILTPPPKTPATMITLADSDTDGHPNLSLTEGRSLTVKDLLNSSSISPEMSFMSLSPSPLKHKLQNLKVFNQRFECVSQPTPIKRSLSSTTCMLPIISTISDNREERSSDLKVSTDEKSNLEPNRKLASPILQKDPLCDINVPSALLKVKEERPSPISECGLCMHSTRSPHTPQCGFAYALASSPVPHISGPPRPLPATNPLPVPMLPPDLSCVFKREKSEGSTFVSLENVDRPSSEERPKNPAPPDTASNEPPSPLPIPPPETSLHPPATRQIVFSDTTFTEPPRPPPPPPLEHSPPPIKMERRTPNSSFAYFCMRNECDRSEHSDFHRTEPRRASHGQMCEASGTRMYKMEAPFLPNSRPRTPQSMINLFTIPTARPRCIIPNNAPSTAANISLSTRDPSTMVSISVQTELSPLRKLVDKSTSIDTQFYLPHKSRVISDEIEKSNNSIILGFDSLMNEVHDINTDDHITHASFQQRFFQCEDHVFNLLLLVEKQEKELNEKKTKLIETLRDLSKLRRNRIIHRGVLIDNAVNTDIIPSPINDVNGRFLKMESCENISVVSSSQEVGPTIDRDLNSFALRTEQLDGERCTSTSGLGALNANKGGEDSFESFVKEEHTTQEYETRTLCAVQEGRVLSFEQISNDYHSLPSSTAQSDALHILENDARVKLGQTTNQSDDIIIMGDISHRKIGLFSPLSPKTRNSSGSEHGYSLRSRGPPSDSYDYNSDSNQHIKESGDNVNVIAIVCSTPKRRTNDSCFNEGKTDSILSFDSSDIIDSGIKKKRKRKTKKLGSSKRKRKKCFHFENLTNLNHNSDRTFDDSNSQNEYLSIIMPQQIESSILTIKISGKFIFTGCSNFTARAYDVLTGKLCRIYEDHTGAVTSLLIIGEPSYSSDDISHFRLITGSDDRHIRIFDGKTANLSLKLNTTEPVTCLEYRWKYVFIGTEGGCGIKWKCNGKDKKLGEKVKFYAKAITCMVPHTEGGRKVLVVAAKSSRLTVRDAMTGLYLRSLEHAPLTVYSAIFEGNILYTGGSDKKLHVYDFCSGSIKCEINAMSSVSSLLLRANNLIAICYDGLVRIINTTKKEVTQTLPVESSHKMFICSCLYKNQIILGNKYGEVVSCNIPDD